MRAWNATISYASSLILVIVALLGVQTPAVAQEAREGISTGDIGHAIATIVIFLLLLGILGRWAWKPIVTQLRRREESIAEAIAQAERRERRSRELLELYKARLANAEKQAEQVLAEARRQAAELRDAALESARGQSRQIIEQSRKEIDRAMKQAVEELRASTAELVVDVARQVLGRQLTLQEQERLIAESVERLDLRATEES